MRYIEGRGRLLLACGGLRTGSTLSYNLVGVLAEESRQGHRVGYVEPTSVALLGRMWRLVDAIGLAVAKSHQAPGTAPGSDAWTPLVEAGVVRAFCTVRDLREVLHSFCTKWRQSPEDAIANPFWTTNVASMRWWLDHGAIRVEYGDLVCRTGATAAVLADQLGIKLPAQSIAEIATTVLALRPPPPEADGTIDPQTLLHRDHLATPGGTGWRDWPEDVAASVRPVVEEQMALFGQVWD